MVTEKYLGETSDPVKKKDRFLDMMADLMFGVPSVIVARSHRGECGRLDSGGQREGPHWFWCLFCPGLSVDRHMENAEGQVAPPI